MQPTTLSATAHAARGEGWQRTGTGVLYYPNGRRRRRGKGGSFHTLRFVLTFEFDHDTRAPPRNSPQLSLRLSHPPRPNLTPARRSCPRAQLALITQAFDPDPDP